MVLTPCRLIIICMVSMLQNGDRLLYICCTVCCSLCELIDNRLNPLVVSQSSIASCNELLLMFGL